MSDERDPTDLIAQEEAASRKADADHLEAELEVADLKWLLSDKRGRRFFWRLLSQTQLFHTSFNPNAPAMAFAEGKRNIGLQLWAMMQEHAPKAYAEMIKEQAHDRRNSGSGNERSATTKR